MFTSHLPLFLLLFCSFTCPIIADDIFHSVMDENDDLYCFDLPLIRKVATRFTTECLTAIDMIPKGPTLDPNDVVRIGLDPEGRLPLSLDRRRYTLPAGFRWGNCLVIVYPGPRVPAVVDGHSEAAAMLQYKVWPHARKAAKEILKRCVVHQKLGGYETRTRIDNFPFLWGIEIQERPVKGGPSKPNPPTNIYIAPH